MVSVEVRMMASAGVASTGVGVGANVEVGAGEITTGVAAIVGVAVLGA
jgi:hypothetical protein